MKKQFKRGSITEEMDKLKQRREDRKNKNNEDKKGNQIMEGGKCDTEYENLIKKKKILFNQESENHISSEFSKIFVLVRKRPISKKEIMQGEIDCISTINPRIFIHECKIKVDGITKYIEDHEFVFDNSFNDRETTEDVYKFSVYPTVNMILNKGIVTCFAYGQTGSGKTYTMKGIQNLAIDSLFRASSKTNKKFEFYVSFFEIYGGRLYDLLNNKNKLQVLEDKNQKVQIFGLEEKLTESPDEMRMVIDLANSIRTTHNTVTNETSSRSHAICNIILKEQGSDDEYGKLTLVDLAGSERAQETQSNDRQRRAEGAEINKSLLALKECIRALDARKNGNENAHVPFRASKLTLVLRDSFVSKSDKSKIIMIACVNPSYSSVNHTINTLRYSDRLKEKTAMNKNNLMKNNINMIKPKVKEVDDINMHVFGMNDDDTINDIDYDDRINIIQDKYINDEIIDNRMEQGDDWEYLKKTVSKDGKYLSDEFIKYHHITDQLIEDEDEIINGHMNIIKEDAKMLTEEGVLITNIKGIGEETDFKMDEYVNRLDKIINKKIAFYVDLKKKIEIYKQHIKEEDDIRSKINPKFFIDN